MTWEERGTIIYLYNGILNGIQVRLLPETLKREAGVNPAQCRCCIGGAVLIGHWGYALGRREPRWMPESEYLPAYDQSGPKRRKLCQDIDVEPDSYYRISCDIKPAAYQTEAARTFLLRALWRLQSHNGRRGLAAGGACGQNGAGSAHHDGMYAAGRLRQPILGRGVVQGFLRDKAGRRSRR